MNAGIVLEKEMRKTHVNRVAHATVVNAINGEKMAGTRREQFRSLL